MIVREPGALRGREREREALGRLITAVRAGRSGVLAIRGEAGIGKTALLDNLRAGCESVRVLRTTGVESEQELAYAALHTLCSQLPAGTMDQLPPAQQTALQVALGNGVGSPPDPFLVGLAMLNCLSDVAERQPVLCLVDDAQWLDRASAQTIAFVARRLHADAVAVVLAVRGHAEPLADLPELLLAGLAYGDARELLESILPAPIDESVRDRFISETGGNPLALTELARWLGSGHLAGGFDVPDLPDVMDRTAESFRRRITELPSDSRQLLLIGAAEPTGDPVLLWRAASLLEITPAAAQPVEAAGLVRFGVRVTFSHPLIRSVAYRLAEADERRRVHRALAQAADPEADPDRRAWHQAQGAVGPDEDVALELERSADRAQARGGLAAAAAFLERAVALTPDPRPRSDRALTAARAKLAAGAPNDAEQLLSLVQPAHDDATGLARVDLLRAQVAFALGRRDAPTSLLRAAERLAATEPSLARDTYLEALAGSLFASRTTRGDEVVNVARAARDAPHPPGPPRAVDALLDGLTAFILDGYAGSVPVLRTAVSAFGRQDISSQDGLRWLWLAAQAAIVLWDYSSWDTLASRFVGVARDTGALSLLPVALMTRIGVYVQAGRLMAAASTLSEVNAVTEASGMPLPPYGAVALSAWRGNPAETSDLVHAATRAADARGEGMGRVVAEWANAVLCNGLGRYADALDAAEQAMEAGDQWWTPGVPAELIEAAVRSGAPARALQAQQRLTEMAQASDSDWLLGIAARGQALLTPDLTAESLYVSAVEHLERSAVRIELARTRLLYGEWLRRAGRRVDARAQLRLAHQMLTDFQAEAFAGRAARELAATGERVRRRAPTPADELTPQEFEIARLAAEGGSNREIGLQLFISHRTVGYHLRKVFTKLHVTNRAQLHAALTNATLTSDAAAAAPKPSGASLPEPPNGLTRLVD